MYMLPEPSSATPVVSQKPAAVAGPPSPSSLPPPATVRISPSATAGPPPGLEGSRRTDGDRVPFACSEPHVGGPPQASAAHATPIASAAPMAGRKRTRLMPCLSLV